MNANSKTRSGITLIEMCVAAAVASMADGSTRFVAEGIDAALWRALSTREGHEALDTSF